VAAALAGLALAAAFVRMPAAFVSTRRSSAG
jgi:hypothetical protein